MESFRPISLARVHTLGLVPTLLSCARSFCFTVSRMPDSESFPPMDFAEDAMERAAAERHLVRKLDLRLLPTVFILFILNFIDRTSITTARLKGIQVDLHLSDFQYDFVLAIFYATYAPAQVPSNMVRDARSRFVSARPNWDKILNKIASLIPGKRTQSLSGMIACRLFLGIPEARRFSIFLSFRMTQSFRQAAFYPGTVYLLSCWYTKKELALRSAILYLGIILANGFGSFISAGIFSGMEGVRGIRAWQTGAFKVILHRGTFSFNTFRRTQARQILMCPIQGSVTILFGILMMFILPDFPRNTRWLSLTERKLAQARITEDAGELDADRDTDTCQATSESVTSND
ncbi:unnamed protein product [Mycena citricolor]|uniref:Uncharacterized protein n=1 Tax=Mycena citricolor TaxID=2018698 RepID=A0AAD2JYC9_9AGAR|nr:unnamed protein product [Mycena citricolor]